ncbi:MAG: hypothetical protein DRQ98_10180 [Gammaproteobacteria bacterium]|nr:MAG: hypothetical protein DRQ98_10180 [Gammaproteobacteria bacterium]
MNSQAKPPHNFDLSGKVALVTGSTAYIGRAAAHKLAGLGATVVVNGRNQSAGKDVVEEIIQAGGEAIFEEADLTQAEAVAQMADRIIERLGKIDILVVSGAGASQDSLPFRLFQEMSTEDLDYYIKAHWLTRAYALKAVAPHMVRAGGGKVVMVGTDAGRIATVGESMIGGSTAGMMQMSRALARELGRDNIRINTVSMSFISDALPRWGQSSPPLQDETDKSGAPKKGMLEKLKKRMIFDVQCEDIAEAITFFACPASDAITGQTLSVNGGLSTPG